MNTTLEPLLPPAPLPLLIAAMATAAGIANPDRVAGRASPATLRIASVSTGSHCCSAAAATAAAALMLAMLLLLAVPEAPDSAGVAIIFAALTRILPLLYTLSQSLARNLGAHVRVTMLMNSVAVTARPSQPRVCVFNRHGVKGVADSQSNTLPQGNRRTVCREHGRPD